MRLVVELFLSSFESDLCRLKVAMIEDVPRIFEAVFACTLEVRIQVKSKAVGSILPIARPKFQVKA